eukprot:NODE_1_length_95616_cov_0.657642.p22 type:complete len:375 gc:universal NODE_1_length_95616_cov_0.657642:68830-67706(-)
MQHDINQFEFTEYPLEKIDSSLKYVVLSQFKKTQTVNEKLIKLISPTEQGKIYNLIEDYKQFVELQNILSKTIELDNAIHPSRARANLINHFNNLRNHELLKELIDHGVKEAVECYDKLSLDYHDLVLGFSSNVLNKDYLSINKQLLSIHLSDVLNVLNLRKTKDKLLDCLGVYPLLAYFDVFGFDESVLDTFVASSCEYPIHMLNDIAILNLRYHVPRKYFIFVVNLIYEEHKILLPVAESLQSFDSSRNRIKSFIELLDQFKSLHFNTFDYINDELFAMLWNHVKTQVLNGIHFSPISANLIDDLCLLIDKCIDIAPQNSELEELSDTKAILNIALLDIPRRRWTIESSRLQSLVRNIFQPSQNRQRVLRSI